MLARGQNKLQEDVHTNEQSEVGSASRVPEVSLVEPTEESSKSSETSETSIEDPIGLKVSKRKKEIRGNHSVHDRFQAETNFTFDLRPRSEDEEHRDFRIDLYLFLPNSMGINSTNFDSEQFFRHRTSHYRVRAPLYSQLRHMEPEDFNIDSADRYFAGHLSAIARRKLGQKVVQDVRLFGNFLHTEFKKIKSSVSKKKKRPTKSERPKLAKAIKHRVALLWAFRRRYLEVVRGERLLLDDEVIRAFSLTDEYLSYRLELVLLQAKEVLPKHSAELIEFLKEEMEYRRCHDLLVLGDEGQESVAFEAYTYRLGLLKKYLSEVLFIQLKSIKKDKLYKNYAAAIGAGLAATVAGLAEHQRVQYLTGNDSGLRLAFLIGVAVVAYIFKDRVKDLSKEYFNTRLKERLPDLSFLMSHKSHTSKGRSKIRELGEISEYFRFLKDVPSDVAYLRTLGQAKSSDPERQETVMHMARRFRMELRSRKHRKLFPLLKNVHRIDISPFLSKLDNPTMPISFVDPDGEATTVNAPKVYHINAVLRYEVRFGTGDGTRYVDYDRYRIIVNKNGIIRQEQIIEQGRLAYEDRMS